MKKFLINILKVSFSNVLSLLSGVLVGFAVPKMLGLVGYANFKIYTLYLTYIALLSLGLGDGLYLRFSGMDRDELDINQIRYYLHKYYKQLFIFAFAALVLTILFAPNDYKFIFIALSLTIISSQIIAVHQNISIITSRFNEYSIRVIAKAILTILLVSILIIQYKHFGEEIYYQEYIIGVVIIDYILAVWYIYTYREFSFGITNYSATQNNRYSDLLLLGFPLLVSNMAGSIFLNLDRQFVSILFIKEDYAIYAFAYNMLTLITVMTSAVSLVLFPALKKMKTIDVGKTISTYLGPFNMVVSFFLIIYFPLCGFIPFFLPKYIGSIAVFRVVLPGLVISTSVSAVLINFYKLEGEVKKYFVITLISIAFSAILNYCAYYFFGTYISISWASIISLSVWYFLSIWYFKKKYSIKIAKNAGYIMAIGTSFYIITMLISNIITGFCIYLVIYSGISLLFYGKTIANYINNRRLNM